MHPPQKQKKKHLYFAYGSNLSPTQMSTRCTSSPKSSIPLAIAFLPKWRWFICTAGYANVLPPTNLRINKQSSEEGTSVSQSGVQDGVYGILYDMHPDDERILDGYEGVDHSAPRISSRCEGEGESTTFRIREREQGGGDYNKWVCTAFIERWLDGAGEEVKKSHLKGKREVDVLVYVDEERVVVSGPKDEYVPRMNRAMRECVGLGVDAKWVKDVIGGFIPEYP
ncbi:hypothetical protein PENSTE_c002G02095 [Penicillium steckii]|uniref:gamma-glutamylcyclotransferase n=1 Tax=Penicillium steckii TaxID=303698 RepID=A0A1V6TU65_9EURO|nr:hypothetical protein PENSTE_c002G02095 [Penicillium steckii]